MHITCIQTGGTIDKAYPRGDTHHGYNFEILDAALVRVLTDFAPLITYDLVSVCRKDSLDITEDDRAAIVAAVTNSTSDKVLITHGTDTIHITAERIAQESLAKTVVLTGANLPEVFKGSDASFNLGMALSGVEVLSHGVYIALNGLITPRGEYVKR